jgi:hypothetical protein
MATIGEINVNFNTTSNNPSTLYVEDCSDWLYAEELPAYLEITTPGFKTPKNFVFKKEKKNIFNSHNLGLGCATDEYINLPDGIYTITLKSGYQGIETTKYYLKTDRFDLEYKKVNIKYGIDQVDEKFINKMMKIKYTVYVAEAHTAMGDVVKGYRYFQEAKKELNRFVDCKDCL